MDVVHEREICTVITIQTEPVLAPAVAVASAGPKATKTRSQPGGRYRRRRRRGRGGGAGVVGGGALAAGATNTSGRRGHGNGGGDGGGDDDDDNGDDNDTVDSGAGSTDTFLAGGLGAAYGGGGGVGGGGAADRSDHFSGSRMFPLFLVPHARKGMQFEFDVLVYSTEELALAEVSTMDRDLNPCGSITRY